MESDIKRIFMDAGLKEKDCEGCFLWAFGANVKQEKVGDARGTWNDRHKHLFEVRGTESMEVSLRRMAIVYKNLFGLGEK